MKIVRDNLMMPRRDWNALGPHVPAWFRRALKRIDPKLELQYMPPAAPEAVDEGVNRDVFPNGVLMICRRLRRSRLLQKRWVYGMTGRVDDPYCNPSREVLKLVRRARDAWRQKRLDHLAETIDRAASQCNAAANKENRDFWRHRIADTCRRMNATKRSMGRIMVQNPGIPV